MPLYITYMLQQVEYSPYKFFDWIVRLPDLTKVIHRQGIVWTLKAKLLFTLAELIWFMYLAIVIANLTMAPISGLIMLGLFPFFAVLAVNILVFFTWFYIEQPRRKGQIRQATTRFEKHRGITVAIAGSYGKTSMKELLLTVLSEARLVAASPGNKNVAISHAYWSKKLSGDEDILLIEFGEGAPGDIVKLAKMTKPDYAVITGLAPNHLDAYKDLDAVAGDLLSIARYVTPQHIFVSEETFHHYDSQGIQRYSRKHALGWGISKVKISYDGISFMMQKAGHRIHVKSGLLGEHQVGALTLVAGLAHELGLSTQEIERGLAKTRPYEHRMQPRHVNGAWIIDDTYNGSLEGLRAGLKLLTQLQAKRKIYVTPGLVEQGAETERVHHKVGALIAQAKPDRLVLMQNSVTQFILKGLEENNFKGQLTIEADPLAFYTNLDQIIAAGDLVLLQNDWTDNYQ